MKQILNTVIIVIVALGLLSSCLKQKEDNTPVLPGGGGTTTYNWSGIADSAELSMNYFWSGSGKYYLSSNSASDWGEYWPNAHALDVLVDAYLRKPGTALKQQMLDLLDGIRAKNGNSYLRDYIDDEEWMALACLRAYAATKEDRFRSVTDELWTDIKKYWSTDLGGGLWWKKDKPSKNTPSNMPAVILAARLYKAFHSPDDLQWAQQIYNWQKTTLYDNNSGLVYDNIDKNGNKNTTWIFTYNQGTFLGGALELYVNTGSSVYLNDALKAADFTLNSGFLTSGGILKDEGGGDGGLFKGVLVRYLTRLIIDVPYDASKKSGYVNFLRTNGESLWSKGTNKGALLFGNAWDKAPGASTDLTVQLSGVMLMESLAELKKAQLF